jgi:uncharacterized membrane protein
VTQRRFVIESRLGRFVAYGLLGWCAEVAFTGVGGFVESRDRRLMSKTSLWMFPTYGLIQPLYEPVHDALRERAPGPLRALIYGLGFLGAEYLSGVALRRTIGAATWDYSHARLNVDGLIRWDYLPLWAAAGLALEPVHDVLTGRRSAAG